MKKVKVDQTHTKHGASSVFLAIVLSALILVECTFAAFVWNLDYAMGVNEALKTEIDTILSDYNRQLFEVYGVYAFTIDGVDDECFQKALEINGLDSDATLYYSALKEFTTEDLKTAINSYYWYRGTGIGVKNIVDGYSKMLVKLDETGLLEQVGQYMQSPAAEYVSQILSGSEKTEDWIRKAGDLLNADDYIEESSEIDELREDYKEAIKDFGLDIDVDIADWESILDTLSYLETIQDIATDSSPDALSKFNVSNYCAYNFDCNFRPDNDSSITGTDFDDIHGSKMADCEYLITGKYSFGTLMEIEALVAHVLILSKMLTDYADEEFRNTIYVIAEVISAIISAISEGTVNIDYRIISVGLIFYCSLVQSYKEFLTVMQGGRAVIFEYDDAEILTYNYRDFLYLFCLCTPMDTLLERAHEILTRDYGTLYKGITLETDFRGNTYSLEKSYLLYD